MDRKLRNIQKGAIREAYKQSGGYDGRFGHRVFTDQKKEADRLRCREDVEAPEEEPEFTIEPSSHRL